MKPKMILVFISFAIFINGINGQNMSQNFLSWEDAVAQAKDLKHLFLKGNESNKMNYELKNFDSLEVIGLFYLNAAGMPDPRPKIRSFEDVKNEWVLTLPNELVHLKTLKKLVIYGYVLKELPPSFHNLKT